jgi:hypothetical protein
MKNGLEELRDELAAISEGRRPVSIKGVKACQQIAQSEETAHVAQVLLEAAKMCCGRESTVKLLPDWRMLPPLP